MNNNCPVCKIGLTDKALHGMKFEECGQCAGVWITEAVLKGLEADDLRDLEAIDEMDTQVKAVEAGSAALACPTCGRDMSQFHFAYDSPVVLHRCDQCEALWIGFGELTQMEKVLEADHNPSPKELTIENQALLKVTMDTQQERTAATERALMTMRKRFFTRIPWPM